MWQPWRRTPAELARAPKPPSQLEAWLIAFTVDEAAGVTSSDSEFAVDNVVVMQPPGGLLSAVPTSVVNVQRMPADDGAAGMAWWHPVEQEWWGIVNPKKTNCQAYS